MDNDNPELNDAEALEEEQEQINQDSNKKAVKVAAKAVAEAYAPGAGGKIVDVASQTNVGNKILETGGNVVSKVNKTIPFGNVIQDQINKANESGLLDAADSAVDIASGDASNSAGNIASGDASNSAGKIVSGDASNSAGKIVSGDASNSLEGGADTALKAGATKHSGISKHKGLKLFSPVPTIMGGILVLFFVFFLLAFGSLNDMQLDLTDGENSAYAATKSNLVLSSSQIEKNLIYVGNSRIIGIKNTLSKDNITFIAEAGADYHWCTEKGLIQLEALISADTTKYVILSFGINDLSNIDNYINIYSSLINKYQNVKIYLMSVNPVDEELVSQNGYNIVNTELVIFNNLLKISFPDNYIDVYSQIIDDFKTIDGIHYDDETNNKIHEVVLDFIKANNYNNCTFLAKDEYFFLGRDVKNEVTVLQDKPLIDAIGQSGIDEVESYIRDLVSIGGNCTPCGVAGAAVGLIDGLYKVGKVAIPYWYGGGHNLSGRPWYDARAEGDLLVRTWGRKESARIGGNSVGIDCTGFMRWVADAAGVDLSQNNTLSPYSYSITFSSTGQMKEIPFEELFPGAWGSNAGHAVLIVFADDKEAILAESNTVNNSNGVQFRKLTKQELSKNGYKFYDTTQLFHEKCVR